MYAATIASIPFSELAPKMPQLCFSLYMSSALVKPEEHTDVFAPGCPRDCRLCSTSARPRRTTALDGRFDFAAARGRPRCLSFVPLLHSFRRAMGWGSMHTRCLSDRRLVARKFVPPPTEAISMIDIVENRCEQESQPYRHHRSDGGAQQIRGHAGHRLPLVGWSTRRCFPNMDHTSCARLRMPCACCAFYARVNHRRVEHPHVCSLSLAFPRRLRSHITMVSMCSCFLRVTPRTDPGDELHTMRLGNKMFTQSIASQQPIL